VGAVSRIIRHQRGYAPTGSRCDVCGGEGLVELVELPDGRMACPVCRHQLHVKASPAPFDRDKVPDDWPAPAMVIDDREDEP
jgi:uncharacterized Zn finger protein (UPF0148 family)